MQVEHSMYIHVCTIWRKKVSVCHERSTEGITLSAISRVAYYSIIHMSLGGYRVVGYRV